MKKALLLAIFFLSLCTYLNVQAAIGDAATSATTPSIDLLEETPEEPERFFSEMSQMLASLALAILLLFALMWFLKRILNTRVQQMNTSNEIKVLERRSLSQHTTVHLLDIGGRSIAIAESSNGTTTVLFSSDSALPSSEAEKIPQDKNRFAQLLDQPQHPASE